MKTSTVESYFYCCNRLEKVLSDINRHGYGLTLGLHTRVDARVELEAPEDLSTNGARKSDSADPGSSEKAGGSVSADET